MHKKEKIDIIKWIAYFCFVLLFADDNYHHYNMIMMNNS